MLLVIETHPIQYHAPVWRRAREIGVPIKVLYGSDFSTKGYHDKDFNSPVKWTSSILDGYNYEFLSANGEKPHNYEQVTAVGLKERIKDLGPAALLSCGCTHRYDRVGLLTARMLNIPVMYRGEANDTAKQRSQLKRIVRDTRLRNLYSRISIFLSIGTEARNHYQRLGVPAERIISSPYAVYTDPFRTSENDREDMRKKIRDEYNISNESKVVLYTGKLSERKGVDKLQEAIALIPEKQRPILMLLGDGELRPRLENTMLPVKTIITGFQPQERLSNYYHSADILVLPSKHSETWGLVINEALEHGLPVVASDTVGSRHDLVIPGKSGEICKTGDVESMANSIIRCLCYDLTIKGRNLRKSIVSNFSINAAADGVASGWSCIQNK